MESELGTLTRKAVGVKKDIEMLKKKYLHDLETELKAYQERLIVLLERDGLSTFELDNIGSLTLSPRKLPAKLDKDRLELVIKSATGESLKDFEYPSKEYKVLLIRPKK